MKVGIELSGIPATDRARGAYLLNELKSIGFETGVTDGKMVVDISIILKRENRNSNSKFNELRIFDVSDAILIPPAQNSFLKRIYQLFYVNPKSRKFLSEFNGIVVASTEQQISMQKYNRNVYIIPDSTYYHDKYNKITKPDPGKQIIFIWDGQGHNFKSIESIISNNIDFFRKPDVFLKIVTDRLNRSHNIDNKLTLESYGINHHFIDWDSKTFMDEVNTAHVGLAPINLKCAHSRAKPCNKLVNYQGLGLTAIASATTAYVDFSLKSPHGVITCNTADEWSNALEFWRVNKKQVISTGLVGRQFVLDNYSPSVLAQMWKNVINDVINKN